MLLGLEEREFHLPRHYEFFAQVIAGLSYHHESVSKI